MSFWWRQLVTQVRLQDFFCFPFAPAKRPIKCQQMSKSNSILKSNNALYLFFVWNSFCWTKLNWYMHIVMASLVALSWGDFWEKSNGVGTKMRNSTGNSGSTYNLQHLRALHAFQWTTNKPLNVQQMTSTHHINSFKKLLIFLTI